jgi:tRNA threonylcarbamoyladenosine biosynthesis protein TsaB
MKIALALHTTTADLGIAIAKIGLLDPANQNSDQPDLAVLTDLIEQSEQSQRSTLANNLVNSSNHQHDHLPTMPPSLNLQERSQTELITLVDRTWHLGRDLSHQIHACLAAAMAELSWQDLEFIAIASGKGSFTSTRIGVVLARTLGQQLDIPVFAIDCDTIAAHCNQFAPPRSPSQGLLELAFAQWQQGKAPNWSEALPIYGGSPV